MANGHAAAQSRTALIGGTAGSEFQIQCPSGEALAGIAGRSGAWLDALGQVCVKIDATGKWIGTPTPRGSLGTTGGTAFTKTCAGNSAVSGVVGGPYAYAGNVYAGSLDVQCRPLGQNGTVAGSTTALGHVGSTTGSETTANCPSAAAASGLFGRSVNNTISGYGLNCGLSGIVSPPTYTPSVGGSSGTPSELACASGEVLAGVTGGAGAWIDRIGAMCVKIDPTSKWVGAPVARGTAGGSGGTAFTRLCPTDHAASGFAGGPYNYGGNVFAGSLMLHCRPLAAGGSVTGNASALNQVGSSTANPITAACANNTPALAVSVRSLSAFVGSYAFKCGLPGVGSPPPPPPPAYETLEPSGIAGYGSALPDPSGTGIYVDAVYGNDANPGTSPSAARKTIPANYRSVGALFLKCGTTINTRLDLSGLSNYRLSGYGNCQKDKMLATIDAGKRIEGFTRDPSNASIFVASTAGSRRIMGVMASNRYLKFAQWPRRNAAGDVMLKHWSNIGKGQTSIAVGSLLGNVDLKDAFLHLKAEPYRIQDCQTHGSNRTECLRVTAYNGSTLSLNTATEFDSKLHAGYNLPAAAMYFTNKRWMMTKPGEFVHDHAAQKLYVWMPDGSAPGRISAIEENVDGINADNSSGIRISNLRVVNGDDTIQALSSSGLVVANSRLENAKRLFINGHNSAQSMTVDATAMLHSQHSAIGAASKFTLRNSLIRDCGGDRDQPTSSYCVYAFDKLLMEGTTIENTGYVGIYGYLAPAEASTGIIFRNNTLRYTCVNLQDCGALYTMKRNETRRASGVVIAGNRIFNTVNSPNDRVGYGDWSQAIYLDDCTSYGTISGNLIDGAHIGVFLHGGFNNTGTGNTYSRIGRANLHESSAVIVKPDGKRIECLPTNNTVNR